jgi:hypothetical protein
MEQVFEGGCLCGAIRYRVTAPFSASGICHCRSCRKAASAPSLPFVTLPKAAFAITKGKPVDYRSSPPVLRSFCGACGSPLTYRNDRKPDHLDIMTCSLDDPDSVPPTFHVWTSHKPAWSVIGDRLPAYETSRQRQEV